MTIPLLQQKPGNGNRFGSRLAQAGKGTFESREVRGHQRIASRGFGYAESRWCSGQGVWIVKTGQLFFRNHYRPPALQLGRATGQEGTGFQDLTLSSHSGFKDLVFSTGQLDSPETSILRFGRWLLDIGLHWLQILLVFS